MKERNNFSGRSSISQFNPKESLDEGSIDLMNNFLHNQTNEELMSVTDLISTSKKEISPSVQQSTE
jgi:hypothetical protein